MKQPTVIVHSEESLSRDPNPKLGPTPSELFRMPLQGAITIGHNLWSFEGLHGGLALALTAIEMKKHDRSPLRSITGQFIRVARTDIEISTEIVHQGRLTRVMNAVVHSGSKPAIRATGTFSQQGEPDHNPRGPELGKSGNPLDYDVYTPPVEFLPISAYTEIRPVDSNRPYAGGDEPELTAWIRLANDDTPIDGPRLVMLADALAPSYTAVLTDLKTVPSIELTVRPGEGLPHSSSPWALIHARTTAATTDGWINEQIDLWAPDGRHLGSAHQLRVVI